MTVGAMTSLPKRRLDWPRGVIGGLLWVNGETKSFCPKDRGAAPCPAGGSAAPPGPHVKGV